MDIIPAVSAVAFVEGNGLTELGEPDRAAAAGLVFRYSGDDGKTFAFKQLPVFGRIKACVIQALSFKASDGLAIRGPTREHQRGAWRGVRPEYWEHSPLIFAVQMEEAIPSENAVKEPPKR